MWTISWWQSMRSLRGSEAFLRSESTLRVGRMGNPVLLHNVVCRSCNIGIRIAGPVFLSCAHYAESMVLLDYSSARRKQRDDPVTAKELAGLRGLLGQLMCLATHVVPQLQAPLSLLLGYLGVATVSTLRIGLGSDSSSYLCS